jgi:hypothetical protein
MLAMNQAERAAKNESTFREANETLEQKADEIVGNGGPTPYLCECENERCMQVIRLTREQYESVRARPRTFVIAVGHQSPDDRVMEERPGFTIVEKTGEEGELVEQQDPRS